MYEITIRDKCHYSIFGIRKCHYSNFLFRLLCGIGAAEIGIPRTRTRLLGTKNLALSSPTNKWHNSNTPLKWFMEAPWATWTRKAKQNITLFGSRDMEAKHIHISQWFPNTVRPLSTK